ncbi:hypothetical protein LP419_24270 [Massilia sp. H-1]|nr:hypothetical protein LP419_24270 [Massilia sp. H-1]
MHMPSPRVALGMALARDGIAHAAIDISDGLAKRHRPHPGRVERGGHPERRCPAWPAPRWPRRTARCGAASRLLPHGDDYELCFTAAPAQREAVLAARARPAHCRQPRRRHRIRTGPALYRRSVGAPLSLALSGFDHFVSQ